MAALVTAPERASWEKMLPAARTVKTSAIDACDKECDEPTSTNPSAKMFRHVAEEEARHGDQNQNSGNERGSDQPNQPAATAKVVPILLVVRSEIQDTNAIARHA
jgi:hypothetical protein